MGDRTLDLTKTVYELCREYPELPDILAEIGFTDITKPGMITTMGRFMTIPKGAQAKKIDLEIIKKILKGYGYRIV